eukprot:8869956-Pyramimonas_sp.AAC.1
MLGKSTDKKEIVVDTCTSFKKPLRLHRTLKTYLACNPRRPRLLIEESKSGGEQTRSATKKLGRITAASFVCPQSVYSRVVQETKRRDEQGLIGTFTRCRCLNSPFKKAMA